MIQKLVASASVVLGLIGAVLTLLVTFGVDITEDQTKAIYGVASALLVVAGVLLHPGIPVGNTDPPK